MSKISVVIPALDEEKVLRNSVERSLDTLEEMGFEHEIIIVEDGCTDRTPEIASDLAEEHPEVKHIHRDGRQGKGHAIEIGFEKAEGDILAFYDADLSVDPLYLANGVERIEKGSDLVIGSRMVEKSDIEDVWFRKVLRTIYSSYIRTLFRCEIMDYQCGFKIFSAESYRKISDSISSEGFFWDTEMIIKMIKNGFNVEEMPVEWVRKPDSKPGLISTGISLLLNPLKMKKDFMLS